MTRVKGTQFLAALLLIAPLVAAAQQPPPASSYVSATGGLTVEKLADLALARNAGLLADREGVTEAQGLLMQAGFRPNPDLDISVSNGAILGGSGESEYAVGYAHTIELGAKRDRRIAVGRLNLELAKLAGADRERRLRADVKARFGEALAAVRNLEAAERLLELNEQSLRIASARAQEGEGAPLERALVQVEVNRMQSDRLLFSEQIERALLNLKALAGLKLDEPLRLNGALTPLALNVSLAGALDRALASRPDLLAARLEIKLGDAELDAARGEAVPNLTASARYSRSTARFDQYGFAGPGGPVVPLRDTDNILSAGVSVSLPFRNRNQGNIQAAAARRQASRHRAEFLEQSIRSEVETSYRRYEAARRALALFDDGVLKLSEENVKVLRAAYDLGELRLLDVVNEQRRLVETQKAYTEILKESYSAMVDLERAVDAPLL